MNVATKVKTVMVGLFFDLFKRLFKAMIPEITVPDARITKVENGFPVGVHSEFFINETGTMEGSRFEAKRKVITPKMPSESIKAFNCHSTCFLVWAALIAVKKMVIRAKILAVEPGSKKVSHLFGVWSRVDASQTIPSKTRGIPNGLRVSLTCFSNRNRSAQSKRVTPATINNRMCLLYS